MMPEVMRDAVHVVLEVPPVIGEIRVPPARSRREQDIDAALAQDTPHPGADGGRAISQEPPLEIGHERAPERHHLALDGLAFQQRTLQAFPSPADCGANCRGPQQQERQYHGSSAGYRIERARTLGACCFRYARDRALDGRLAAGADPRRGSSVDRRFGSGADRRLGSGLDRRRPSSRTAGGNARLPARLQPAVPGFGNHPQLRAVEDAKPPFVLAVGAAGETARHGGRGVTGSDRLANGRLRGGVQGRCRQHD